METKKTTKLNATMLRTALLNAFRKLDPRLQVRNPVMFVVEIGSILTTVLWFQAVSGLTEDSAAFVGWISAWLWFTVLFANFAEAIAEGRGKAQAEALRRTRQETTARKLDAPDRQAHSQLIPSTDLRKGDLFLVQAGEIIPADGEIADGIASVDESAVTGESAPVVRESGGDRSAVTGGTRVLSDWLIVRASADPGEGFLDRMIHLVEGAKRQKTPNEIALNILLAGFTIIFLIVCTTLLPFSLFSVQIAGTGKPVTVAALIALLVCLIPTTIGGLLSAIGIAGMDRLIQRNVIAFSGRAIEAAGDVDVLLLDKTGTITLGNRQATEFIPVNGTDPRELAEIAQLSSLADETPEGRSIVVLAKEKYGLRSHDLRQSPDLDRGAEFIPFTAQTRMSGVDWDGMKLRKGAMDSIEKHVKSLGKELPMEARSAVGNRARTGGTPLVLSRNADVVGVIHLRDIVKGGIKERFAQLRRMGLRTVMITGDNPITAAAIAAEAGVDDMLAEATPEDKLKLIREIQAKGQLVAMTGDGTNDAPALAQADVAVAMNTGTQPAREAANMVDLDSNPTKLIEIVEIGKQLLITRGALTTFSIANDVSKYVAIIPAAFASTYPALGTLDIMRLQYPILSAVIFNALIIVALIPLALRGVAYSHRNAQQMLQHNLLVYGVGGLIAPFIGIKIVDLVLASLGIVL